LGFASPDRDISLPFRQVEKLVAHQQFDQKARVSLNTVKDHRKRMRKVSQGLFPQTAQQLADCWCSYSASGCRFRKRECRRGQAGCFALEQVHIANKAVYLASDETERTTGQIFPVDRGATIRW
jgi:hypothetical protein